VRRSERISDQRYAVRAIVPAMKQGSGSVSHKPQARANGRNRQITMKSSTTDIIQPLVELAFQYDQSDKLVKTRLQVETQEEDIPLSQLTHDEQTLREECETDIHEGLAAVNSVGYRLHQIKSKKLYRSTHQTFEKYCEEVFGISRVHANRQISAHITQEELKSEPIGSVAVPENESQARTVADLSPDTKKKVARKVKETVGDKKATTKDWKKARQEALSGDGAPRPAEEPQPPTPKTEPSNVIEFPVPANSQGMVPVKLPCEFIKSKSKVPTIHELSEMAITLDNISDSSMRKKELMKLARDLSVWLREYAKWEQAYLIPAQDTAKAA